MGIPYLEGAIGVVDGVNTVFFVSRPYTPGTTHVWVNGLLQKEDLVDGWIESNPSTGEVTLKEAPRSSGACPDVVQVAYVDTSEDPNVVIITDICGSIDDITPICGSISTEVAICGEINDVDLICGEIIVEDTIEATLVEDVVICATIAICD